MQSSGQKPFWQHMKLSKIAQFPGVVDSVVVLVVVGVVDSVVVLVVVGVVDWVVVLMVVGVVDSVVVLVVVGVVDSVVVPGRRGLRSCGCRCAGCRSGWRRAGLGVNKVLRAKIAKIGEDRSFAKITSAEEENDSIFQFCVLVNHYYSQTLDECYIPRTGHLVP